MKIDKKRKERKYSTYTGVEKEEDSKLKKIRKTAFKSK